ncbi:MAG: glycoside hydrolase family 43 protein [Gemmatimonadota bacterium]|nr:glycoside hydrolase family 43 protein [Gemmatimonadota bacterium]
MSCPWLVVLSAAKDVHVRIRSVGLTLFSVGLVGCAGGGGATTPIVDPPPAQCTFTNPLAAGADPWVVKQDGMYYYIQSIDNGIWVSKSATLTGVITAPPSKVWAAPTTSDTAWNRANVWAPELHFIDGRWYIYYAAGAPGSPFLSQHAGVLESTGADALGTYNDRGMLYTGDSLGTTQGNRWAIDLTTTQIGTQRYAVWSGWANNATTDKTEQQLYIAQMDSPWHVSGNRVQIAAPTETWEKGTELALEEGPEFVRHGTDVMIVYSAQESWLKDYQLGRLKLQSAAADPMSPASWAKAGPVFSGNAGVYGVGHASFTLSPDGTENWIVYHSKTSTTPGWDRNIRMQKFTWAASGEPVFGEAVLPGTTLTKPAGECR